MSHLANFLAKVLAPVQDGVDSLPVHVILAPNIGLNAHELFMDSGRAYHARGPRAGPHFAPDLAGEQRYHAEVAVLG